MQESLTLEHGGELVADTLEKLLDGGGVAQECDGHLETARRNVTLRGLDVVGNPFDEVCRVLVLDVLHLLLDLLHGDLATEDGRDLKAKSDKMQNGDVKTVPSSSDRVWGQRQPSCS